MKFKTGLSIFLAVLLIFSVEIYILTYSVAEKADIEKSVENIVDRVALSPILPDNFDEGRVEVLVEKELENAGLHKSLLGIGNLAKIFLIVSIALVFIVILLAWTKSPFVLGFSAIVIGLPFFFLATLAKMAEKTVSRLIPEQVAPLLSPEINSVIGNVSDYAGSWMTGFMILGCILIAVGVSIWLIQRNKDSKEK